MAVEMGTTAKLGQYWSSGFESLTRLGAGEMDNPSTTYLEGSIDSPRHHNPWKTY